MHGRVKESRYLVGQRCIHLFERREDKERIRPAPRVERTLKPRRRDDVPQSEAAGNHGRHVGVPLRLGREAEARIQTVRIDLHVEIVGGRQRVLGEHDPSEVAAVRRAEAGLVNGDLLECEAAERANESGDAPRQEDGYAVESKLVRAGLAALEMYVGRDVIEAHAGYRLQPSIRRGLRAGRMADGHGGRSNHRSPERFGGRPLLEALNHHRRDEDRLGAQGCLHLHLFARRNEKRVPPWAIAEVRNGEDVVSGQEGGKGKSSGPIRHGRQPRVGELDV